MNEAASHRPERRDEPAHHVRVMTVDDQPVFLQAARALIDVTPGFEAVAEATSGRRALELAAAAAPDLVVLDVRMAGLDGIETARRLNAEHPAILVVLVSSDDMDEIEPVARRSGVAALVRKQDLGPGLLRRLWAAHRSG